MLQVWSVLQEVLSVFTFNSPFGGELWSIRSDYASGDLGWDPLKLMPKDPKAADQMRLKELKNGRLAMLAVMGIFSGYLNTGVPGV